MIEDIQIHESIDHLSILELKEVTKRDRDRGIEVEIESNIHVLLY